MIFITTYNENWPKLFEQEKTLLTKGLAKWIVSIEHIGSTAIPSACAKPIIDIVIGVTLLNDQDMIKAMLKHDYDYKQVHESVMPERRYFKKKCENIAFNVHIVKYQSDFYKNTVLFRNILRDDAAILKQYVELKFKLAKIYDDEAEFANAKTEFVLRILSEHKNK